MAVVDAVRVASAARDLLVELWRKRSLIWSVPPELSGLIPVPVEIIAREVLGLTLEQPEEIACDREGYETAGLMERHKKLIVAAQKYPLEWRRFTIAHEIGHWVLHPGLEYHRDRPLSGGERANKARPLEEQEADRFAAELLMPTRVLRNHFRLTFGEPIDGTLPSTQLASELSRISQRTISPEDLSGGPRQRSILLAGLPAFRRDVYFASLQSKFGVSNIAMAIQLEDLRLVL